jgi:hypothetical protein
MKQKETEFSWPLLFIVTSLSFFVFSGLTKLLNGSSGHAALFFTVGFAAFVFYAVAYALNTSKPTMKKKRSHSSSRRNRVVNY